MSLCCTCQQCDVSWDKRQEATADRKAEEQASDSDLLRRAHEGLARPLRAWCGEEICVDAPRQEEGPESRVGPAHDFREDVHQE